jgi:hypothetical protein
MRLIDGHKDMIWIILPERAQVCKQMVRVGHSSGEEVLLHLHYLAGYFAVWSATWRPNSTRTSR